MLEYQPVAARPAICIPYLQKAARPLCFTASPYLPFPLQNSKHHTFTPKHTYAHPNSTPKI